MSDLTPRLVIIESPYASNDLAILNRNVAYAKAAMIDCLQRGEAPFAGHLMYATAMADAGPQERQAGMKASFAWGKAAEVVAVYTDLGITSGMKGAITRAKNNGKPVEERSLPKWAPKETDAAKAPAES